METLPHPSNFCGGNFQDWLEVNLLPECNARCSWCIEKIGYHPSRRAGWAELGQAAIATAKRNIILLGGEPTLYPDLRPLVEMLVGAGRLVWVTTNGSRLRREYVEATLGEVTGLNISIHHYDMSKNAEIVGLRLDPGQLEEGIRAVKAHGAKVRLNCNMISGYIDSAAEVEAFIEYGKRIGASSIRFAELKLDADNFVDLQALFEGKHGLNEDPFVLGCNQDTEIHGMPVNFRQMCGLQTSCRREPVNPKQFAKEVLYYDGKVYQGWQSPTNLDEAARLQVLEDLAAARITVAEAARYF